MTLVSFSIFMSMSQLHVYRRFSRLARFIEIIFLEFYSSLINLGSYAWNYGPIIITESFYLFFTS
jgi:hypothetical protein